MNMWLAILGSFILGSVITYRVQAFLIELGVNEMLKKREMFMKMPDGEWAPFNPFKNQ